MRYSLDQVIAQAAGLEDGTRNSLVHLAAEDLAAAGNLTLLRTDTDASGAIFDIYYDKCAGKTYITRRPTISKEEEKSLRKRLAELVDPESI